MSEMNEKEINEVKEPVEEPKAEEPKAEEPTLTAEVVPEAPAAPVKKTSGLATAGMIVGIISAATSVIPVINIYSIFGGILAIVFGIICLCKKASTGKATGALITGIAAILVSVFIMVLLIGGIIDAVNDVLEGAVPEELSVTCGDFVVEEGTMWSSTYVEVVITNEDELEKLSFEVEIEAVDEDGNRLATETVTAYNLRPGQSQKFRIFKDVPLEMIDEMEDATFQVLSSEVIY